MAGTGTVMRVVRVGMKVNLVLVREAELPLILSTPWNAETSASGSIISLRLDPEVEAALGAYFTRETVTGSESSPPGP